MSTAGSVIQCHQANRYGPLPLQLWKATVTVPAAVTTVTVTSPNKLSGTAVAAWIDPTTLTAAASVKVYDATDALTTPTYIVDYTVPDPAVETHSALSARCRVMGTLTCVVASATAADSFDLYVWVDPNADDAINVSLGDVSVDIDADTLLLMGAHAEDAAHTSGQYGVMGLAVRKDTAAALAGTDGDYAPLEVDATGHLHTLDTNSGAVKTAVELIDDAVYADDADWTDSASKHMLVGGLYQSSPQTITDGDVGPFEVDANGNLKVVGTGTAGTAATGVVTVQGIASGVAQPISGTVTANLSATDNAVLDAIALNQGYNLVPNGTNADQALTVDATAGGVQFGAFNADCTHVEWDCQTAQIRVTFDSSAPTSSNGHLIEAGASGVWPKAKAVAAKFIRTGATSAVIHASEMKGA